MARWHLKRDVVFCPKICQIGPKWNKSCIFKDQISVHFGSDLKKSQICPMCGESVSLWAKSEMSVVELLSDIHKVRWFKDWTLVV